ncbi:vacuolar protein sorting-associated protein 33B-like [Corticium candelabrum]|uniref:vacuolar protein sorting-associated protein 33B-like n=1 Tax=Corticium candelabrum TaxID=121492 RepID=UPI002E26D474|nr:vacuolar protein sorting-associated protein 33B-like [Corticium candelabrum]
MFSTKMGSVKGANIQTLQEIASSELRDLLRELEGPKDLFIDEELMTPLNHIAGATLIRQMGVAKMFKLGSINPENAVQENRVFLAHSEMVNAKFVADHVREDMKARRKRRYLLICVPRKTSLMEMVLEQEGVHGRVQVCEWALELIPFDTDVMSMERPRFHSRVFVEGDQTWLHDVASSLISLQMLFGTIPTVYGVGKYSKMVAEMVEFMTEGEPPVVPSEGRKIDALILMDRSCDYVTPLCSQVTYQGILDDVFKIKSGFLDLEPSVTGKDGPVKLLLNSAADSVFADIRDMHFVSVFGKLQKKAKELQSSYSRGKSSESVQEMKKFVQELGGLKKQHQSLAIYIAACEAINNFKTSQNFEQTLRIEHLLLENLEEKTCLDLIEELIHRQGSLIVPLRLLCLYSQTENGIRPKTLQSLRHQFLQTHGYHHLSTFYNLKRAGLLVEQGDQKGSYHALRRRLQLVPKGGDQYDLQNPIDMAYVFGGAYSPISCRLVEEVLRHGGWLGLEEVTRHVPEEPFARAFIQSARANTSRGLPTAVSLGGLPKVTLIYFIGGCSYSEVSALRFLAHQLGVTFYIATTHFVNFESLVESAIEKDK